MSQETTRSSLKENDTAARKNGQQQEDEIKRGSSIGSPPKKKETELEEITNEGIKDTWQQQETQRRTGDEMTGKSGSSTNSLLNKEETSPEKMVFTVLQKKKTRGR